MLHLFLVILLFILWLILVLGVHGHQEVFLESVSANDRLREFILLSGGDHDALSVLASLIVEHLKVLLHEEVIKVRL